MQWDLPNRLMANSSKEEDGIKLRSQSPAPAGIDT